MRTIVFINSHSRQAARNTEAVKKFFSRRSTTFNIVEFIVLEELDDFENSINKLKSYTDIQCIIIGSGDGTIVAILNALKKRRELTYGFIPLGTSNTFVRSLGLSINFMEALDTIGQKHVRQVSLGSINGTLFANIADIGVAAHVADNLTDRVKKYFGSLAYAISGIRELVRHDAIWCEVKIDGKTTEFYTHSLLIANGKYRGPIPVSKDTSAFSDSLTLGYSDNKSRLQYLRDAFGFILGKTNKRKSLHLMPIQEAVIKTKPVQMIQADGEVIGKTPAKIKVIKNAIRVFTPLEVPDHSRKSRKSSH